MDTETKNSLTARKEEIIREMPELKLKKQQLVRELENLSSKHEEILLVLRDSEREILDITREIGECEEHLQTINTSSPLKNKINTKLMWDSIKGL